MTQTFKTLKDVLSAADRALAEGDTERALALYTNVLQKAPRHSKARKAVQKLRKAGGGPARLSQADVDQAVALLQRGDFAAADKLLTRLLTLAPREPVLHNFLGIAKANLDKPEAAIRHYKKAISLNPDYGEARGNLGTILMTRGDTDEAIIHLRAALRLTPGNAEAVNSLANALRAKGQYDEALALYDKALALNPGYATPLNNKAITLALLERNDDARIVYQRLLNLDPANTEALQRLSVIESSSGDFDAASRLLQQVIAVAAFGAPLKPGQSLREQIAPPTTEMLDNIVARANSELACAGAFRELGLIHKFTANDPLLPLMQKLAARTDLSGTFRMHLEFALSKALFDTADPQTAFAHLERANREKRKTLTYSTDEQKRRITRLKRVFSPEWSARLSAAAPPSDRLIFILGLSRSGTSLVEQILASHSRVEGTGERDFIESAVHRSLDAMPGWGAHDLKAFAQSYCEKIAKPLAEGKMVTDKMPANHRWIGLILTAFPQAKIIEMQRDPRDVGLSNYRAYFDNDGSGFAYDQVELAEYMGLYNTLMAHWHTQFPGKIHRCVYERLIMDQEGETRRLLDYCGLDFEEKVLEFHRTQRVVQTASLAQVRQKIYTSSHGGWRALSDELQPLIETLNSLGALPYEP